MSVGNINQGLNGLNSPLSYMGVNASQPSQFRTQSFDPGPNDSKNFALGAWWLNTTTLNLWYLASLNGHIATWLQVVLNGGQFASSFPTDSGMATPIAGVLNVLGGTAGRDINTSGAGNTVHVNLNNAITLGDLASLVGFSSLTLTTGNATIIAGNLNLADTNAAGTQGVINFGGDPFIHDFGTDNVFVGDDSGNFTLTTISAVQNTGIGARTLDSLTTGSANVASGTNSLSSLTSGFNNSATGFHSMMNATIAGNNSFYGYQSGVGLISGEDNAAIGINSFSGITTGDENSGLGANAGQAHTLADSNNICIGFGVLGVAGQSNTCRIGNIRGATTNVNDAIAVLIDSTGQLGTVSSSIRFKENVQDMSSYSEDLMSLRPVIFNYKNNTPKDKSVGLIAEEVETIMPDLVVYDEEGLPQTVKYHDLVPMLLNEVQKLHRRVKSLEHSVANF